MLLRIEAAMLLTVARAGVALAAAFALAGCTATGMSRAPAKVGAGNTAETAKPGAVPTQIEQADGGFTLTEEVRVGADTRADYDNAIRLLEQKQYEPGIALLLDVTRRAPNATAAHIDLGIAYSRSGDLDGAEASLKHALQLNPRHPIAHNELGMLYRRKGQFAAARASYESAIAVFPGFHFARLNLAILCDLYLSDPACALENYEAYQQAVPEDKQAAMWITDLRARTSR